MPSMSVHGPALGDFLDGEVELVAGDEIDHRRALAGCRRLDRHLGADQADLEIRDSRPSAPRRVFTSEAKDGVEVWSTTRS